MPQAMVIDDSRAIRMILGRILRKTGFEVCEAGNGREGLVELARRPSLSLVMVDWNMPEMNGLEFIQAVRADARYNAITLMMVTTETHIDQMVTALDAGANEYVMKPFTEEMIVEKLRILGFWPGPANR
jgi:two-component system, chemotaxis family, chemotaxis protein CheY